MRPAKLDAPRAVCDVLAVLALTCAASLIIVPALTHAAQAQSTGSSTPATRIQAPPRATPAPRRQLTPEPSDPEPAQPQATPVLEESVGRDLLQGPETDPDAALSDTEPKLDASLGLDPALARVRDDRPADEVRTLEGPPAGHNPDLFTIEPEPSADRRIAQLYRFEPFEAKGYRSGGFVILPSVELGLSHDSNVFTAQPARADSYFDDTLAVRIVSDWRAHAVELTARGLVSDYSQTPSLNDRTAKLEARGRLDISRFANLEALASREILQDSPQALDTQLAGGSQAAARAQIKLDTVAATYTQRFNRVSVQLRGSSLDQTYSGASNADRNVTTQEIATRLSYELKPTLGVYVDGALNQREHDMVAATDGILRNSTGDRLRAGLSFGSSSAFLRGDVSLGYGTQRPSDRRLGEVRGLLVDANLAYKLANHTTFLLQGSTDVTETTLAGSSGALQQIAGLEMRQELTRRLIATAGVSQTLQTYAGASLREHEVDTKLGLDYYLTHDTTLLGRYTHSVFTSTDAARNYIDDTVRIAVRVRP